MFASLVGKTKEVALFRRLVAPRRLPNLKWVFSLGGTQDRAIDLHVDRVADVFPTEEAITAAGWHSQRNDDRLAVLGPAPVGMAANRIPHILNQLNGHRFSELQNERDRTSARRDRSSPATGHRSAAPNDRSEHVIDAATTTPDVEGDPT